MTGNALTVPIPATSIPRGRGPLGILAASLVLFAILQGGVTVLAPRLDLTSAALGVTVAMLLVVIGIERWVYGRDLPAGFRALGYGRARPQAMVAAILIALAMLTFFPLYSLATGTSFALRGDWPWVLLGAVVLNGIGEETLFRGFVFGHLRAGGLSFRRAGALSLAIIGAVHLLLFFGNPPIVALLATALAVAAAYPFAFLFERAGGVIWAGVIVHVAAHAFRLLDLPEAQVIPVASAWIAIQFGAVFLVFAFRSTLLRARP
jgi:membrane protease YdiL (CAAX protease family)